MANILLFDDNLELLEMFQILFARYSYEIQTVNCKTAFMQALIPCKPDLILMDIMLRDADGRELCKQLKEHESTFHIPVILMSANPNNLNDYKKWDADDFLEKPFTLAALLNKVNLFLASPVH